MKTDNRDTMERTQIYLTKEERSGVARRARRQGIASAAFIRALIDKELSTPEDDDLAVQKLDLVFGKWKHRRDLDPLSLRGEWDR